MHHHVRTVICDNIDQHFILFRYLVYGIYEQFSLRLYLRNIFKFLIHWKNVACLSLSLQYSIILQTQGRTKIRSRFCTTRFQHFLPARLFSFQIIGTFHSRVGRSSFDDNTIFYSVSVGKVQKVRRSGTRG